MARASALAGLAALALVASAPGSSTGPPPGRYQCTVGDYQQVAGTLRIFSHHRYRFRALKVGRFAVHGRRIAFRSGAFHHKFTGRWYRTESGLEIGLIPAGHRAANEFCDRPQ